MTSQEIHNKRKEILHCIEQQQVGQAIRVLSEWIPSAESWALNERLSQVKMSYDFMLKYLTQGVLDPGRADVLSHIVNTLATLTDECAITLLDRDSPELFHARRRELASSDLQGMISQYKTLFNKQILLESVEIGQRDNATLLHIVKQREQCESMIFNKIWCTYPLSSGDCETIGNVINDNDLPVPTRCLLVMALFLGLMKYYDEGKMLLLIDTYTKSDNESVQLRSLISLLLCLNSHRKQALQSRNLSSHMAAMTEQPEFATDLAMVIYRLTSTRNTDRVTRRVTQDIMPDIMKASPDLVRKMRDRNNPIEIIDMEENPEWHRMLEDSGLAKRMEEFTQLQQEGNDVFISTFSRLKTFPFFNTLSNWFMPYHSGHSVVMESFEDNEQSLREMVSHAPYLCNSDRYSLCLTLRSIPDSQRQMMKNQVNQQMEDLKQAQTENQDHRAKRRDTIATRCVQDLYRFFKLFSRRREFLSVMDTDMDFTDLPYLHDFTDTENIVAAIAEFYLQNGFDRDAIKYYSHLLNSHDEVDPIVFQKIGFAHERLGEHQEALRQYQRYELAHENDLWTLKHVAGCYRALKQTDLALKYYNRIEQIRPGQVSNTLNMGHTMLEAGRVEQALQHYFKADLQDEAKHRAWRPIAWCSFLLGNDERCLDYYNRVIESGNIVMSDYLNRGHAHLCSGHLTDAINDYRLALDKCNHVQAFEQAMLADNNYLMNRGITITDLRLIIDAVITTTER